jgi:hypothetical protein
MTMGEETTKGNHAVSSLHDLEMEDINDVWNTFRLPIPIRDKLRRQNNSQNEWLLLVVDQLRLLQTMKEVYENPNNGNNGSLCRPSKHQRMKSQINLALSGQARIEQTSPFSHQMTNNDDTTRADDRDKHQPILYENAHRLVQTMREETEDMCNKFHEWLNRHPEQQHVKENLIANIFFAPLEQVIIQDEPLDDFDEGDGNEDDRIDDIADLKHMGNGSPVPTQKRAQSTTRKVIPTSQQLRNERSEDIDPIEFQKQQQELLEEELSSMAARLKSSTLAMNATLQTQTKDLESMEDIAQANLDNVSSTTKKVEQRLAMKKGWKKKIATWTMIFTVIGMWVLCFMIMRTVPKRKVGKLRVVGLKSWTKFITEKTGQMKGRFDKLMNGKSVDSNWEQSKATNEKERQRQKQQQQRQQYKQRQECEIRPDGSQVCRDREMHDNPDAKAQQLLAERKQRRIEENMANPRTVDAIDPADITDEAKVTEGENDECIPPTLAMKELQNSLKGMENARNNLTKSFESSPDGSEKRQSLLKSLGFLYLEFQRYMDILERTQHTARTAYWDEKEQGAVQGVPFCTSDTDKAELEQNQFAWAALSELIKTEEVRLQKIQEKEAELRREAEDARFRKEAAAEARKKDEEKALEARKQAEEEAAAADARKKAEEEALEARKKAEEEAAAETRKKAEEEAAAAAIAAHEDAKKAEKEATDEAKLADDAEGIEKAKEMRERNRLEALRTTIQIEAREAREVAKELEVEGFRATDLRFAASRGQNDLLAYYISEMPIWIDASDAGGWRPLHEAARAGNLVGIELLISAGCDISSRTGRSGNGGTALWWAIQRYGESHDVVALLRSHNALEVGPDKR